MLHLETHTLVFLCTSLLFIVITAGYLWFVYLPYRTLKRIGINGPPPSFFYGNYKEEQKMGSIKYLEYLKKRYGKLVGFYTGRCPSILVTDLDILKDITVKDFEYFRDRRDAPLDLFESVNIPTGLLVRKGDHWYQARHILSPTFSASKMKLMDPLIVNSAKVLVSKLEEHAETGKSVEMFRIFGSFTMETILSTAFGRVIDVQNGESNVITEAAATIFSSAREDSSLSFHSLVMLTSNFPFLKLVLQKLSIFLESGKAMRVLRDTANEIVKQRRSENSGKHRDLLQLMIDASFEEDGHVKKLSNEEIISHSITFMLAGYETTANALTYTSYLLALNPDVQLKLQEEIDDYFESNPTVSLYQASQELKYLEMVINESLRLYPPAPTTSRVCTKQYVRGDLVIPKGVVIIIPPVLIHKDPEHWENPEEFNALRFSPEEKAKRPQLSFLPFGFGPRNCIGMRFAMMEAKIALIEMMKKVSFIRSTDTEVPLTTTRGITMSPKNGVYIKINSRRM